MNRHTVQFVVMSALGISSAQAHPTIPEVQPTPIAEVTQPKPAALDALVLERFHHLMGPVESQDEPRRALAQQVRARLHEVPKLLGDPVATKLWATKGHDLATQVGRIDAVLDCLTAERTSEECDLNGLLSPKEALKRSGGQATSGEARLSTEMKYHGLVSSCPNPVPVDGCGGFRVDAKTGTCEQMQMCNKGRAFAGGRVAELVGDARTAAGRAWADVALEEHASIASFARHTLELLAVGAPQELVAACTQAQLDEVRHAELALELARRFGAQVSIGVLDTAVAPRTTLFEVMKAVAADGCLGETLAAVECGIALERTEDPEVRAVLEAVTTDEAQHAALAWRTLAWGLPRLSSGQRAEVLAVFADPAAHEAPDVQDGIGVLGGAEAKAAREWALTHVIAPALAAVA